MVPETPLQARRRNLYLSLRELAEYTGINRGSLSLWERGRYLPTADEQSRLTAVLQDFELAKGKRGSAPFLTPEDRQNRATARRLLTRAISKGELVRGPCERCGSPKTNAHHRYGYTDPLRVVWLCGMHHGMEHSAMNEGRRQEGDTERRHRHAELVTRARTGHRAAISTVIGSEDSA